MHNTLGVVFIFEPDELTRAKYIFKLVKEQLPEYEAEVLQVLTDLEISQAEHQHLIVSMEDTQPLDLFIEEMAIIFKAQGMPDHACEVIEQYQQIKSRPIGHGNA